MNKKWLISGGVIFIVASLAFIINGKDNSTLTLNQGSIKENSSNMVAIKVSEDGVNYTSQKDIPTGDYTFNTEKSKCRIPTTTLNGENAPVDESVTIEYTDGKLNFLGLTKNDTKCYVYFYKTPDTEKPTISNVTTTVTKTEINVTVTASDNKGVTEYYYQLDSGTAVKETTNTHTFTGLNAGQTYSLKVWVKDAAGNSSDVNTSNVTTTPNGQTSSTIIANSNYKTSTPTFNTAATSDEGVYRVSDGMYGGYSYYWRGAATTNHVIFANICWRIVRINGDGSIRLIYNGAIQSGNTCHENGSWNGSIATSSVAYNGSYDYSSYVGWTYTKNSQRTLGGTASNAKTQTENWYSGNITGTNDEKVATGKFCNDRNVESGSSWEASGAKFNYASLNRLYIDYAPTATCNLGDVYNLKVGAITADEVEFAGGRGENRTYYLYNGQNYWTMTPLFWNGNSKTAYVSRVQNDGAIESGEVDNTYTGIRPVINLKADTLFNEGSNGTSSNPYIVQ